MSGDFLKLRALSSIETSPESNSNCCDSDTLGLEILSGQIRVLHLCVKQWKNKSTEKHYRNENRREQILSLAEECGHGFRNINNFFQNN